MAKRLAEGRAGLAGPQGLPATQSQWHTARLLYSCLALQADFTVHGAMRMAKIPRHVLSGQAVGRGTGRAGWPAGPACHTVSVAHRTASPQLSSPPSRLPQCMAPCAWPKSLDTFSVAKRLAEGRAPWLAEGLPKHTDLSLPHGVTKQHGPLGHCEQVPLSGLRASPCEQVCMVHGQNP